MAPGRRGRFLVLAALYESWSVPLGVLGFVAAMHLRRPENDVFFKWD